MSGAESSPLTMQVHESIEQLIAETVRRSQEEQTAEREKLTGALRSALAELEASQKATNRAIDALRAALGEETTAPDQPTADPIDEIVADSSPAVAEAAAAETEPVGEVAQTRGEHALDVIAHGASIGLATGLQGFLRSRDEVKAVQTREFVNGELRLHADMATDLNASALEQWLNDNGGRVATTTDSVLEIRFDA